MSSPIHGQSYYSAEIFVPFRLFLQPSVSKLWLSRCDKLRAKIILNSFHICHLLQY